MQTVETLKHEHRLIECGLDVLEAIADRLARDEFVAPERIQALLSFFRMFADWCHHAKEEGVLFPALERVGIHRRSGPVPMMLCEHNKGRALLHRLADASPQLVEDRAARAQFAQAAHAYVQLMRDHITKEDNVLFRMAESLLADKDAELNEAFAQHERKVIGAGVHERFQQLIQELEDEFLGERALVRATA